jgi:hypothetical protein
VNEQPGESEPLETAQVTPFAPNPVGVLESVTYESEGLKPLPAIDTVVPLGPELGVSEIPNVAVNVEGVETSPLVPVTVTE